MKMKRAKRSGRLLHTRRDVTTTRPMHITVHVEGDVPSLRHPAVLARLRELVAEARERGVRTVATVPMRNHLHWFVVPTSREALRDATRYVLSRLAKFVNKLFGRRGKVFTERYYSDCCRSARHIFQTLGYILRNAATAGYRRPPKGETDPYTDLYDDAIAADRFLRAVFGPTPRLRRALLVRMTRGPVPWTPLAERLQPTLPGLQPQLSAASSSATSGSRR